MSYSEDGPAYDPEETRARTRPMRDRDAPRGAGERLDELDRYLHLLGEQVDRASEQLGPILQPERPSPALAGSTDDVSSELSARLARMGSHADSLGRRLRELLDRVDL